MTKRYSIAEARDQLPRIVHAVECGGAIEITRRGRPVAMLVSITEYERLREPQAGFWHALEAFRQAAQRDVGLGDDEFLDLRDRGPGRQVDL